MDMDEKNCAAALGSFIESLRFWDPGRFALVQLRVCSASLSNPGQYVQSSDLGKGEFLFHELPGAMLRAKTEKKWAEST